MRVLITGGAGFVGSALARDYLHSEPGTQVVVLDNLHRRGSEQNRAALEALGVTFIHGDIRCPQDLDDLPGNFDLFIEASAEPSVHAGQSGSPAYVLQTNLVGTLNCAEFARRRCQRLLYLSTSRVYSIAPLKAIRLHEGETRFEMEPLQEMPGASAEGIAESFPTHLPRSLYGASKLASELVLQEYTAAYNYPVLINRCGVLAGPGQFGKVDQGVFSLWVYAHLLGRPLRYTGFGGRGKQVRDLLHPTDLFELLQRQCAQPERWNAEIYNVGGGQAVSVSLLELTALCQRVTGREVPVSSQPETAQVDIPFYVSDAARARADFGWAPRQSVEAIVTDIAQWAGPRLEALAAMIG